jgi:hypothetical protein
MTATASLTLSRPDEFDALKQFGSDPGVGVWLSSASGVNQLKGS